MQHGTTPLNAPLDEASNKRLHRHDRTLIVTFREGQQQARAAPAESQTTPAYKLTIRLDRFVGRVTPSPTCHNHTGGSGLSGREITSTSPITAHLSGGARNRRRRHHQHVRTRRTITGTHTQRDATCRFTPNFCCSSTTTRPRSRKRTDSATGQSSPQPH